MSTVCSPLENDGSPCFYFHFFISICHPNRGRSPQGRPLWCATTLHSARDESESVVWIRPPLSPPRAFYTFTAWPSRNGAHDISILEGSTARILMIESLIAKISQTLKTGFGSVGKWRKFGSLYMILAYLCKTQQVVDCIKSKSCFLLQNSEISL